MPTLDELSGLDMMGDPSTVPGGAQERFLMGLLSHAANQKGYQALQLPALTLLLRGQLQGFDQQRAQQQKQAETIKAFQLQHLIEQINAEKQKTELAQRQMQLQADLPNAINAPVKVPGYEDAARGISVGETTRPPTQMEQVLKAIGAYPNAASGLLGNLLKGQEAPTSVGGIKAQIINQLATNPNTGKLDPQIAQDLLSKLETNPQGAEGRVFDIIYRSNTNKPVSKGELDAVDNYQKYLFGKAWQQGAGNVAGATAQRGTPAFQAVEKATAASGAAGRVEGTGEAERNQPLGPKAATWFNPTTLQAPSPKTTANEAMSAGFIATPPNAPQSAESARAFLQRLNEYDKYFDLLPPGTGNTAIDQVKTTANWAALMARRNVDKQVTNFLNLGESTAQAAKAFGDAANISIVEQEQIRKQMPTGKETREVAKGKVEQLKTLIHAAAARGFSGTANNASTPAPEQPQKLEILEIKPKAQ